MNIASLSLQALGVECPVRQPDLEGPAGRAWILSPSTKRAEHAASLGTWLVNVPNAHPWWEWWVIGVVHLRDEPGLPEAKRSYDGAEFEFTIITIDPEECPEPDPDLVDEGYHFLSPPDVVEQFHGITDGDAARVAMAAATLIVNGTLSPDEDFREQWHEAITRELKTLRHSLN